MRRICVIIAAVCVLIAPTITVAQSYVFDHFDGDSLASEWVVLYGDTSNYNVSNSRLNVTNTVGGDFDGNWTRTYFRRAFFAPEDFLVSVGFEYNRNTMYKMFKISLLDSTFTIVLEFMIWDTPTQWILTGPDCYQENRTGFVPSKIEIQRLSGLLELKWDDDVVRYSCPIADTVAYIMFTFGDFQGYFTTTSIDSVLASIDNQAPILDSIGSQLVDEGNQLTFLVTATDPDSTIPYLTTSLLPDGAMFEDSGNGTGVFDWTPGYDQSGDWDITFYATNDSGAVDSEAVVITVNHVNLPPTFDFLDDFDVIEGSHLEFVVTASDFDGDSLILSADNIPPNSAFFDSGNGHGLFTFDPDFDQGGFYTVTFSVSDGFLGDSMLVGITVHEGDPVVLSLAVDGNEDNQNVVEHQPIIAWSYTDPLAKKAQTQFEIAVGTDNDWAYAEMWNPAPFVSPDTFIVYGGIALLDGETYYLRLRVHNGTAWSEWYESSFRMNTAPTVPIHIRPINDEIVNTLTPTLWFQNSNDAENDTLTYDLLVIVDTLYGEPDPQFAYDVTEGEDSTGWQVPLPLDENKRYWWHARAYDGFEYSDWSDLFVSSFFVDAVPEPPSASTAILPPDTSGFEVVNMLATFIWAPSTDPDPLDTVRYRLEIAIDSNFSFVNTVDSLMVTIHVLTDSLQYGTQYWWRVWSFDTDGYNVVSTNVRIFWTWTLGDLNHDHSCDVADLTFIVDYLFRGGYPPVPTYFADVNGDCSVDVADLTYLVDYLFGGGPAPVVGCE